ncbi:hypothetical protein OS189_14380 [Sulfitobacter sp. F26169L]|uniref:hypothetical protein n=1 Tax=Sulfitobacter sp. F26169L TaxID=2996015 RepID=UPI002260AF73|nr:hypothetical protein [Sulfitobacter sp. F26169L]MCX7567530.1 hypothetical protein [Sulfitobacter sp. F26169L]
MLVFSAQNLVLLSVPKTGSTAMEVALKPWADIAFYKHRKHTPVGRYQRKIAPFLCDAFGLEPETMAVIRAPLEHLRSWYRYRASTLDVNFDTFVQAVISPDPPDWARIGTQLNFLTTSSGILGITHLFAYEAQPTLRNWLNQRMGANITFKPQNVSPPADTTITSSTRSAFETAYAAETTLHARTVAAGGHLIQMP